jgi:putative tryptophan/tyrosine transport system substrate-binding protein
MRRREFITLVGGSAATWPLVAHAQQTMPTIGIVTTASPTTTRVVPLLVGSLEEDGWNENQNYRVAYRWAEGHPDRIPAFINELVTQRANVIVVFGEAGIQAAQQATKTIPIVGIGADMVRTGRAATLSRPGGNLTGVNVLAGELDVKRLEILHQSVSSAKRIGALALPDPGFDTRPELETAARQLDLELVVVTVHHLEELTEAVDALQSARVDAVNVLASSFLSSARARIIEGLNRARLPAIYEYPEIAEEGGLLGYGPRIALIPKQAARLVSKILRGARPEDLPVEQADRFDLVVNLKTAKALGLTMPPTLLVRADKVIE